MGENTGIGWTNATFNPWAGCTKISPACKFCYAEADTKRRGFVIWGPEADRRVTSDSYWKQPLKWNREAFTIGVRKRVFCGSWCDVMEDRPELIAPRRRLYELIDSTPSLDWQLLSKRPENYQRFLPSDWLLHPRGNVWLGTTAEDQEWADKRIPLLLQTPAALRFVSLEPLLGSISLERWTESGLECGYCGWAGCESQATEAGPDEDDRGFACPKCGEMTGHTPLNELLGAEKGLDWVIVGGESGPCARPMHPEWARRIVQQCQSAGVPVFVKQICERGRKTPMEQWPEDLRVREMPEGHIARKNDLAIGSDQV